MFKIGLENRDFCKSLHFYIVDAGKKKKKKKKKTSCICWLVQLLSALRAEDIALRAMPSLFVFLKTDKFICNDLAALLSLYYIAYSTDMN